VRRHSARVFKIVSRFFRGRAEAEDMAQEVFLKAYTQLASYEGRGSFEGWLSRIAANTCLNQLRTIRRHPESSVSDLSEDEADWFDRQISDPADAKYPQAERDVVAADLADKLLGKLSPDDRLALTLVDGEQLPVKEVAELTGWSQAKVKVQAFRARRRMRKAVEELMGSRKVRVA
jgi:RNA polymerase sigma-70 factor (ECF subfamily)